MVEMNATEAVYNNVVGTLRAAQAAVAEHVDTFVLVSSDKAVRPTNVMGATKRVAELISQSMNGAGRTRFCIVRFGNVLDSSGSVVPLFRKQIQGGGPVSVTHPEVTRYFMTIPEAAQLVLQAGSMASGGDVFVLDMGKPVRILDLARKMIRLGGLTVRDEQHPDGAIEIRFTGLRLGEKLHEELLIGENVSGTPHPLIMRAMETSIPSKDLQPVLTAIEEACTRFDNDRVMRLLGSIVPITREQPPEGTHETPTVGAAPLKLVH
jgi:FlaA1/EpsC-like NDP-sugar epimerase